jgi:hypothetical protein
MITGAQEVGLVTTPPGLVSAGLPAASARRALLFGAQSRHNPGVVFA